MKTIYYVCYSGTLNMSGKVAVKRVDLTMNQIINRVPNWHQKPQKYQIVSMK